MPPEPVLFVQHNQHDGRISHENATKAWAYVSRRAWQEKPKQLTIKIWEPPNKALNLEQTSPFDDQNTIIVSYSKFEQAYASKKCLQHIELPEDLGLMETTFRTVYEYNHRCWLPSPHRTADTQLEIDTATMNLHPMQFMIECGVDSLLGRRYTQAFACFEYAARILKDCLTERLIHSLDNIFCSALPALLYAQSRNAKDVVQLFLKQISGLAAVSGGLTHPLAVIARNLLSLGITPELVNGLTQADLKLQGSIGPYTRTETDGHLFEFKCAALGNRFPLQDAEHTYRYLMSRYRLSEDGERNRPQFTALEMARLYLKHHKYVEAACVVSDAPAHFAEYVDQGWAPTVPLTAPLSLTGILYRLTLLAQALAGQGKHGSADATFRTSILAGQKYLTPDTPQMIQVQKAYAIYLLSQNRDREAEEIESMVDAALKMYMLGT